MSKFCTRCGRPLQEGEICTCQTNAFPNGDVQQPVNQAPPMQQMANQVKRSFLQLLAKPVTVGKEVIGSADIKMAAIFLVLQGIASAIFASAVGAKIGGFVSTASGFLGSYETAVSNALSVPYIRIILVTLILSIAFSCILALLLWVGHMAIQCQTTYQKMLSAAAIRSAVMVPTILVFVLLFEINTGAGFFLFIMGNVWGFFAIISAVNALIPDEKKDIFPLIMGIIVLVFIVVVFFIMSKAWSLYLPDTLRAAIDSAKDYISNPKDLLELLEDLF